MIARILFIWIFMTTVFVAVAVAQTQTFILNGFIEDSLTGEKLIGANILEVANRTGTTTNQFGFFSIPILSGKTCQLSISYVGYKLKPLTINPQRDTSVIVRLTLTDALREVTIVGGNADRNAVARSFGMVSLNTSTLTKLPSLTGIKDIMRSSQLLPGIQSGKEGSSQIFIRGGSADQNLILLDDIPVYYVNHIGGFISVFDAGAINLMNIYKGAFPARYGGRLSGILDIRLKEGSKSGRKQTLQIGILSTEYKIEGPVKTDTSSYLLSVRRCNVDIFTRLYSLLDSNGKVQGGYTFYDVTGKYSRKLGARDKLFFITYFGRDKIFASGSIHSSDGIFNNKASFSTKWGNYIASAKWLHVYSGSLFSSLTVAYTRFAYNKDLSGKSVRLSDGNTESSYNLTFGSNIQDILCNYVFEKTLNARHHLSYGILNTLHLFKPHNYSLTTENASAPELSYTSWQISPESRAYLEDKYGISDRWYLTAGAHLAIIYSDTRTYLAIEPRLLTKYSLNDNLDLSFGYSRMTQNLHLLSSSGLGLPTDLWIPVTAQIPPGVSDQLGLGINWQLPDNLPFKLTIEAYFKKMKSLVEFKEGAVFFQKGADWQSSIETGGTGISKGVEFLLEKQEGSFTGWIGYTISKNDRTFPGLNGGKSFPFRYDRRHNLSVVANYELSNHINLCGTWVYWTGEAITLAYGEYSVPIHYDNWSLIEGTAHVYSSRNGYRLPDYHRLDIAIQFKRSFQKVDRTISVGIYNVYNRKNPFFLFWDKGSDGAIKLYQVTIFPIMPNISVAYTFK